MKALLRKFLSEGDNMMYPEMVELLSAKLVVYNQDTGDYDITTLGREVLDGPLVKVDADIADYGTSYPLVDMEIGSLDGVTFIEPLKPSTLDIQIGGEHYKKLGQYQPWQVAAACMTPEELRGYMKGTVLAYIMREGDKGGDQDIEKAKHTIELWQEVRKDK